MSSSDLGGFSWYAAGMRLRPATTLALTTVLAALSMAPTVAAQPIEPLGQARPTAPAAPADVATAPADATKTESGLAFKVLAKPRGTTHPGPHDKVTITFTGWTPQGEVIASSVPDGEPWALLLDDAIKGLSEGLLLMGKGEKRRLWIPADLATSGRPKRRGPPGPAVFDVELVSFAKVPESDPGARGRRRALPPTPSEPRPASLTSSSSAEKERRTRRPRAPSRSTTAAGRPTESCSTAPCAAASRPPSPWAP